MWGSEDEKLHVELDDLNQPIGPTAAKLQSQLGIIARNGAFTPLIYNDWRAADLASYKERIWDEVKVMECQ